MHLIGLVLPEIQKPFIVCRPAESLPEGSVPATPDSLWRRYSEFELLRMYLLVTYPYIIIPPLPEKRVSHISMYDEM